ncbi:ABC transporter permease [Sphingobium chungbukense]|uniref:Sugar ABC transporter permease n=1 Tax=Sphingobium chungbukense TaxID=56193 RepID=A0A0M3ASC2_9SPHN|nr:ABC transporter permease [Sphingobium chungbukense]KKW93112.1 sugar ABC transporter permease [Sphingobium chungbukense]
MQHAATFQSFFRSLRIQWRVIHALLMREVLTRYGRHNIGFLWLFVEPMIFTIGVTAIWTFMKALHGVEIPIEAFALTGYSSLLVWRNMPARCMFAITINEALMHHNNVRPIDIYLSRILLEAIGTTMSFIVLGLLFISIGWMEPPENLLKVIAGWAFLIWFGASLAMLLGTLSEKHDMVEKFWHPAAYLMFPFGGAAFLVDAMPVAVQPYILLLPQVSGTELLRDGFFGSKVHAHYDLIYVIAVNMLFMLVALIHMRKIQK